MGQKVSSGPRVRTNYGGPVSAGSDPNSVTGSSTNGAVLSMGNGHGSYSASYATSSSGMSGGQRNRATSLVHVGGGSNSQNGQALNIPGTSSPNINVLSLHDSDDSSEEGGILAQPPRSRGRTFPSLHPQSLPGLPAHIFAPALLQGIKCPVCSKFVPPDDIECHLVICLTKPRIVYNEDVLAADAGECVICLDDMEQGDTIARLPCLCIYHKSCIDSWFERNRSCPEHPSD